MPNFVTTPGYEECAKCFGWQIVDLTPRDAKGWPIGPQNIVTCDHCLGRGETLVKVNPWAKAERIDVKPSEVAIDDAVPAPGWPSLARDLSAPGIQMPTMDEIIAAEPPKSGWPQGTPTHSTAWPEPSGWPSMREPGNG